jgi:hypothetical protein
MLVKVVNAVVQSDGHTKLNPTFPIQMFFGLMIGLDQSRKISRAVFALVGADSGSTSR